ncbi:MAG TPA: methionine adenosyltransferase [Candidatus Saccharimonadales bacterium]|nr:methionine adenosyltransferase [Candidatus Saccharimonadales bacterium]
MPKYFTSESVCAGHPDKVCDQISDAVVDALMAGDPQSHAAVETAVTENRVVLFGEIQTKAKLDAKKIEAIARKEVKRLGYDIRELAFHHEDVHIDVALHQQSAEIAAGVDDTGEGEGAGDQGMMFGYATNETPNFMPLPIELSHRLVRKYDELREDGTLPFLRPDGKAQVTIEYKNNKPVAVHHVVSAVPHDPSVGREEVQAALYKHAIEPILEEYNLSIEPSKQFVLNGTGVWHFSGPAADAGLTGRKIIVDTYGAAARVGGGAFSGKDCSKVDRSGAYAARYLAKNIVAAGLADRAEVSLAYFIGARRPVMQEVETFGTAQASDADIKKFMDALLDTSVQGIIKGLDLRRPIYRQTAAYGHFGRSEFPWEQIAKKLI